MSDCLIVVPCFNEADRLDLAAVRRFIAAVDGIDLLFVNDGSTDATLARLEELRRSAPQRIRVRDLPRNGGKAEAVRQGLLEAFRAGPRFAGFLDADLSTPLEALPRFVEVLQRRPEIQMVFGTRLPLLGRNIERDRRRRVLGRVFARAASAALGVSLCDTQCGAKLFRAEAETAALFEQPFVSRWIFDVEIVARWIGRARAQGGAGVESIIYELPLEEWREVAGSKVRPKDFVRAAWELAVIYQRYIRAGGGDLPPLDASRRPEGAAPLREHRRAA